MPSHCYRMGAFDRDLIRGGHYGQRSCEPHLKAEHMAAPTNAVKREESSCQLGAVHTWHEADIADRVRRMSASGIIAGSRNDLDSSTNSTRWRGAERKWLTEKSG